MYYKYKIDALKDNQIMSIEQLAQERESNSTYSLQKEEVLQFMTKLERLPEHVMHVADLSLQLFDQLQDIHQCEPIHRNLLEFSAYLHDVGWSITGRKHHKHSMRLIQNHNFEHIHFCEQQIIAQIARYHRKSKPKKSHSDYSKLNSDERLLICKLASLLRLGDALDRNKQSLIQNIECFIEEGQMCVITDCMEDITAEYEAIERKKDLFESTFDLKVELTQQPNLSKTKLAASC